MPSHMHTPSHSKKPSPARCRPVIFDRIRGDDARQMDCLLESGAVWRTHDTLRLQIRDLIETRLRSRCTLDDDEVTARIHDLIQGMPLDQYGRWVFYPWSGVLVHLLPPSEFRELRLDRNQLKITAAEQGQLSQLTVGIAGLSVGNAIANTLALEGAYGHLKLADFDRLALSNMNRVHAAVHDIDLPKTAVVARQIYELDPYASLTILPEGLTPDNLDEFLLGDPPLQVVVDECDDISMKIRLRERARALGLPVLMETSDRGMLDVERFDQEQYRPVLHGLLGDITSEQVPLGLSSEEKVQYILPVVGTATLSTRMGASLVEIEQSVSTWPQLGADVTLGGASMTVALRRLALGQPLPSGRRFIDLDALVVGEGITTTVQPTESHSTSCSTAPACRIDPRIPQHICFLVEQASLAPSGGNCQPWRFAFDGERLWLTRTDQEAAYTFLDVDRRGSHLALGAAIESIDIAAASTGYRMQLDQFPCPHDPRIVGVFHLSSDSSARTAETSELATQITSRATNRMVLPRVPLAPRHVDALASICKPFRCHLEFVSGETERAEIGNIMGKADRIRFTCRELHQECMQEMRWTSAEVEQTRDGVDLETLELTPTQRAGMLVVARTDVAAFLRKTGGGGALEKLARDAACASSAVVLLSVEGSRPEDAIRAGRGLQRLWLAATSLGLAIHPWTAAIYMFALARMDGESIFTGAERTELAGLEERFSQLYHLPSDHVPSMLFRLFYADPPQRRSLRLPLEQVLSFGPPRSMPSLLATG